MHLPVRSTRYNATWVSERLYPILMYRLYDTLRLMHMERGPVPKYVPRAPSAPVRQASQVTSTANGPAKAQSAPPVERVTTPLEQQTPKIETQGSRSPTASADRGVSDSCQTRPSATYAERATRGCHTRPLSSSRNTGVQIWQTATCGLNPTRGYTFPANSINTLTDATATTRQADRFEGVLP